MITKHFIPPNFGINSVIKNCSCPKCKKSNTFKPLPENMDCADIMCDFCGFLAQVKTELMKASDIPTKTLIEKLKKSELKRNSSGIYIPSYFIFVDDETYSIYYLPGDYLEESLETPFIPISKNNSLKNV